MRGVGTRKACFSIARISMLSHTDLVPLCHIQVMKICNPVTKLNLANRIGCLNRAKMNISSDLGRVKFVWFTISNILYIICITVVFDLV
jgi:hypothetical protein